MDELFPTARELMAPTFLAVRPSLPLVDAIETLAGDPEDTAFVIDEHDRLVGLLTEKHCLHVLSARAYDEGVVSTVTDVMCAPSLALAPSADVYAIARAFHDCSCGALPVIDNGRVVGAVSQVTMLRTFMEVFRHRAQAHGQVEQTADDMKGRPESKEQMQRVFGALDRDQLGELMRRPR